MKQNETVPGGQVGEQKEIFRAQNIRPRPIIVYVSGLPLLCQRLIITLMVDQMRMLM